MTRTDTQTIGDFAARLPNGSEARLGEFAGKVVLVVNTASKCGFTPQYAGLEPCGRRIAPAG